MFFLLHPKKNSTDPWNGPQTLNHLWKGRNFLHICFCWGTWGMFQGSVGGFLDTCHQNQKTKWLLCKTSVTSVKQTTLSGFDYRSHLMGSWNPAYYASTPEQVKGSQQGVCTWMRGRRPWCLRWKEPKWLHANFLKMLFVKIKLVNHGHVYVNLKTFLRWFGRNCIQHFTGYENLWKPCFISNLPDASKKMCFFLVPGT